MFSGRARVTDSVALRYLIWWYLIALGTVPPFFGYYDVSQVERLLEIEDKIIVYVTFRMIGPPITI